MGASRAREAQGQQTRERVLKALSRKVPKEIVDFMHKVQGPTGEAMSISGLRPHLQRMGEEGYVEKQRRGRNFFYALTDKGVSFLEEAAQRKAEAKKQRAEAKAAQRKAKYGA